jgi:hypothetical protein
VQVGALRVSTIAFGKVEARWGSFWGEVVGKVASVAMIACTRLQEALADGNFAGIVKVAAPRAIVARTCGTLDTQRSSIHTISTKLGAQGRSGCSSRKRCIPVVEKKVQSTSSFLVAPE